ncbi:centrosomal protein of 55 kDa isoform X2 [Solea solea]|uniref:centrosomal protein of 55 kDa isoform X2 n=1 Tax=Solea solea TaxID=90069 RepID=UPI00272A5E5D|nr:centrosomal protein of 55 kDa isoform X2 [Solea solea]
MTSKGNKETIIGRLGFKSSSSAPKAEAEMERVRKENAHLKRKIDELHKRLVTKATKPPDSDNTKLLERIVTLETLWGKNNQQLLVKEQEIESLRQLLSARGGEVVTSLQAQLEQQKKETELKDALIQSISQEKENLKNEIATVSARCQSLEIQVAQNGQMPPPEQALVQDQLKDALEKNQQWLTYDQQREAYVQSLIGHTRELEQQLAQPKKQDPKPEANSDGAEKEAQLKCQLDQISALQKDLESQKDQVARAKQELHMQREQTLNAQSELQSRNEQVARVQEELLSLQRRYEDKCGELSSCARKYGERKKELEDARMQLQAKQQGSRHKASAERRVSSEEVKVMDIELEKKRSDELLLQIRLLAKDFENEKLDRQSTQHQLNKLLKEFRRTRDQTVKLNSYFQRQLTADTPEPCTHTKFQRLSLDDPMSPPKATNLDESFLECPGCQVSYPASRHRELLRHIDFCLA